MSRLRPVGLDHIVSWAKAANGLTNPDLDGEAGHTDVFGPTNVRRASCKACGGVIEPGWGLPWVHRHRGGWILTRFFLCPGCDAAVLRAVPAAAKLVFS